MALYFWRRLLLIIMLDGCVSYVVGEFGGDDYCSLYGDISGRVGQWFVYSSSDCGRSDVDGSLVPPIVSIWLYLLQVSHGGACLGFGLYIPHNLHRHCSEMGAP